MHRCDRTGGACGYVRFSMSPLGKPGPTLSLRDESPAGENRGGTPAGERARKRRAAQAALLRGASRTPLACGQHNLASAGVLLPFCFVVAIASFIVVIARWQNSDAKKPRRGNASAFRLSCLLRKPPLVRYTGDGRRIFMSNSRRLVWPRGLTLRR